MRYLFLDTSTSNPIISIIENNSILFHYQEYIEHDMSSIILPIIKGALDNLNFDLCDIDKIFIVNGPGSFTGIRIGVSIAKTISFGFDIPVLPISSLEVIASHKTDKKYIIPMIDARRGNVYGAIYDNNLNIIKEEKLISINDLLKSINDDYVVVSYDFDKYIYPEIDIISIINKHINDKPVLAHNLNPRYLKLTQAEENLIKNG